MKRLFTGIIMAALILTASQSSAQIRKIPAVVTEAFAKKFPAATDVAWGDKLTNFEATFNLNNHHQQATFDNKGEWKRSEVTLAATEIPAAVTDGIVKSKYNDWEDRTYVLVTESNGKELYRVLVKKNDFQKKYLYFNREGQLVKDSITL